MQLLVNKCEQGEITLINLNILNFWEQSLTENIRKLLQQKYCV